ncbi:MAG: DUF4157 domain-containing protein [Proteobacteria bacterium]|nr:DUF4157 domain-containing protein [Pseudomonadota bacterium]
MQAAHAVVAAAAKAPPAAAPKREPARPERDEEALDLPCRTCAGRPAHDFGRVAVHGRAPVVPQASLMVGPSDDHLEREADAAADRVMRAPAESGCALCGGSADDERVQRQTDSPYSPDDGVVTDIAGSDAEQGTVQAKPAAGGTASAAPVGVAPAAGRAIRALRGGGTPLPAPLRSDMESRYGHDFSRVRVHTGPAADSAARSIHARAYTLGHDVVFRAGQFDAASHGGRHLIAHELAHVIQQGHAPRGRDAGLVQRVQWTPNSGTGKASAPWGAGGPTGKMLKARTDAGTPLDIWRPDDNATYWCHGYTFGGSTAKGGPYSIFGQDVPTVLKDDGWKPTYACMTQPSDILVFSDAQGQVMHTGIIRQNVSSGGQIDEAKSTLQSKWGAAPLNTGSWDTNIKQYGKYRCYSKTPQTGVCAPGANEQ